MQAQARKPGKMHVVEPKVSSSKNIPTFINLVHSRVRLLAKFAYTSHSFQKQKHYAPKILVLYQHYAWYSRHTVASRYNEPRYNKDPILRNNI